MSYSITQATAELEAMLHGTTLNKIQNLYGVYNRAARQLLFDLDPQETIRINSVVLYNVENNGPWKYALPSDIKGNKIIDLKPQASRNMNDRFTQNFLVDFDVSKEKTNFPILSFQFDSGNKTLLASDPNLPNGVLITPNTSYNSNGTWTNIANISGLTKDNIHYVGEYNSSAGFNVDSVITSTTASFYNSGIASLDLSDYSGQSSIFSWFYLPTASDYTSVTLYWGQDLTNRWYSAQTTQFDGTAFQNGWNLLKFPWTSSASSTGTPDATTIDTLQIDIAYNGTAENGLCLGPINCQFGNTYDIIYYSKYLFRNATTGAWQETVLTNDDLINLDTETYNLFLYQAAFQAVQQSLGSDAGYDTNIFLSKYNEALIRYKSMYKSQVIKPRTQYYQLPNNSPNRWYDTTWYR